MTRGRVLLLTFSLIGVSTAQALCPTVPTVERYRFSATGNEVTDSVTGLVWARCSVGQTWSGSTCTGTTGAHSHEQALLLAQPSNGWRLPNVKELSSLADKGCRSPAIDSSAFPNTPSVQYWSSSPFMGAGGGSLAWNVHFENGSVFNGYGRSSPYAVRLVRGSR